MEPIYMQIEHLTHVLGSAQKVMDESGVQRGTFYNMRKHPDTVPISPSASLIRHLYQTHVPTEWDNVGKVKKTLNAIDTNQLEVNTNIYKGHLDIIRDLLSRDRSRGEDSVDGAGIDFCEASIGFKQRFEVRVANALTVKQIDQKLESALGKLQKHAPDDFKLTISKIILTRMAVFLHSKATKTRSDDSEVRQRFEKDCYLEVAKIILKEQPWHWKTARNGLVAASVLQDKTECFYFWETLKSSHKCFTDPKYKPTALPSLLDDPDLGWFRKYILFSYNESTDI